MVKPSIRDGFIFIIQKRHSFECQHSIALAYRIEFVSQIRIEMVRI